MCQQPEGFPNTQQLLVYSGQGPLFHHINSPPGDACMSLPRAIGPHTAALRHTCREAGLAGRLQHRKSGADLDGVAQRGAGAVHLQRADRAGVDLPRLQGGADDLWDMIGRSGGSHSDAGSDLHDEACGCMHTRKPIKCSDTPAGSVHLLLGGPIWRCQAAGPPVLVDGRAVDHNGVLRSGIALGQDAVQHLVLYRFQEVHLPDTLKLSRKPSSTIS